MTEGAKDLRTGPLAALVPHLVDKHHAFTREALARATGLLADASAAHGREHPALAAIRAAFEPLRDELLPHMQKEEMILFPHVLMLEAARSRGEVPPRPRFGTIENPIRMMNVEHDHAHECLRAIREASSGYTPPDDAHEAFTPLYDVLRALDEDLVVHMDLETNVLFQRGAMLERG